MTTTTMDLAALHAGPGVRSARQRRMRSRTSVAASSWIAPLIWMIALALFVAGLGALALLRDGVPSDAAATIPVRVSPSDTLWSIARANPQPGVATAARVEAIAHANALSTASLTPGTVLQVPAPSAGGGQALAQGLSPTIDR